MFRGASKLQVVVLIPLLTLASCAGKNSGVEAMTPVGPDKLRDENAQAKYASVFWKRHGVPDMRPYNYKRIAIAEFTVEFVSRKIEGNKSTSIEYSTYLMNDLPNSLYKMFRENLESRGLEVLPPSQVIRSRAFARLDTEMNGFKPELNNTSAFTSDTGRVKELTLYAAEEFRVVRGSGDADIESVEAEMLKELEADVVLRVRIRVGAYGGHPSLERGSTVWVLSPNVAGNLSFERSLISNIRVVEEKRTVIGRGSVLNIMVPDYLRGINEMFPAFLNMAHMSADSAPALPSAQ
ncbi:MAG: hypothetical protein ACYTHJ_07985 [Planctomycetota bacterium]